MSRRVPSVLSMPRVYRLYFFVAILLVWCFVPFTGPLVGGQIHGARRFHPTRVLVKPKVGNTLNALHTRQGNVLLSTVRDSGLQVIELGVPGKVEETVAAYERSGEVEFAEPDYILRAARAPNDPRYLDGTLWGLHNTGLDGGRKGADLGAEQGWDILNSASNVVVAVVDSGIRYTHEDLKDNLWVNSREIPDNGVDDDDNGIVDDVHGMNAVEETGDPWDEDGHGTHVAGIIGAAGDNGKGTVGVAWKVQIMACKFMDASGAGTTSDAVRAIDYARRNGADIINASWGGESFSLFLQAAIRRARDAGVVVVAAAGNEALDLEEAPFYPASLQLSNVVTVAATTRGDLLADYSNFGVRTVTVAAPGSDILSTWNSSDRAYMVESGTSMAAPYVAGVFALAKAYYPNDSYSQLIQRVIAAHDALPSLAGKSSTGGRVSLSKVLGVSAKSSTSVRLFVLPSASLGSPQFTLSGEARTQYLIEASDDLANWTSLVTKQASADGTVTFSDPGAGTAGKRFYRARVAAVQ